MYPSNIHQSTLTKLITRFVCIAAVCLTTACATTESASYTTENISVGETRNWKIGLLPEPGKLDFTMKLPYASSAYISLTSDRWTRVANIVLSSTECFGSHQVGVQYFTSEKDSYFKYFKLPASSDESFKLTIAWQDDQKFIVSLNDEIIELKAYKPFQNAEISSYTGPVMIESVRYSENTITPSLKK